MDAVLGLLVLGALVAASAWLVHRVGDRQRAHDDARAAGRLQHRRSGDYPASCSWCRSTTLARRLFVYERSHGSWHACDVLARLQQCPDSEVELLARTVLVDEPRWRRLCSERCIREFLAAEHVSTPEPFARCEYCSTSYPAALARCANCGAPRNVAYQR